MLPFPQVGAQFSYYFSFPRPPPPQFSYYFSFPRPPQLTVRFDENIIKRLITRIQGVSTERCWTLPLLRFVYSQRINAVCLQN